MDSTSHLHQYLPESLAKTARNYFLAVSWFCSLAVGGFLVVKGSRVSGCGTVKVPEKGRWEGIRKEGAVDNGTVWRWEVRSFRKAISASHAKSNVNFINQKPKSSPITHLFLPYPASEIPKGLCSAQNMRQLSNRNGYLRRMQQRQVPSYEIVKKTQLEPLSRSACPFHTMRPRRQTQRE